MTNPMLNSQPNYSGVTIQIANPAVNVTPAGTQYSQDGVLLKNNGYATYPQQQYYYPNAYALNSQNPALLPMQNGQQPMLNQYGQPIVEGIGNNINGQSLPYYPADCYSNIAKEGNISGLGEQKLPNSQYGQAYPVQYYLNNYNMPGTDSKSDFQEQIETMKNPNLAKNNLSDYLVEDSKNNAVDINALNQYKDYADSLNPSIDGDMTASKTIIDNLNKRNEEIKDAKKNTKEKKIVALTDEYIKSLENYLDNPNDELRLMASKEILTRLDEDKDRYDDAALNALLNKMLQDPSKLVRLSALSAFASQLACGNDYTVQLLHNIQSDPNGDKEDALQASDILLKMSAGVEVNDVPADQEEKREIYKMKPKSAGV